MKPSTEYVYWTAIEIQHNSWHLTLAATDIGLCLIGLPNEPFEAMERWVKKYVPGAVLVQDKDKLEPYIHELTEYFNGHRKEFTFPLDLRGTPFQVQVWQALLEIPFGKTKSYSEIAVRIGRPAAVRAVGAANGDNPIPIVIPCHRAPRR